MQRTWTWANFGKWWGTGRPGVLQSMRSQRIGHDWVTEQQQREGMINVLLSTCIHLQYKESWMRRNWCFWTVMLEKTLENPLASQEIKPVNPKGNQSWIFIGRTDAEAEPPIVWQRDVKSWLIWKDPDAGKDWRWEEKGTTEDEMVGWHHRLNAHEFE